MKYIRLYENFTNIDHVVEELEEITLEFKDIGFEVAIKKFSTKSTSDFDIIIVHLYKKSPKHIDSEHLECILRMCEYLRGENFNKFDISVAGANLISAKIVSEYDAGISGYGRMLSSIESNFKLYTIIEFHDIKSGGYKQELINYPLSNIEIIFSRD